MQIEKVLQSRRLSALLRYALPHLLLSFIREYIRDPIPIRFKSSFVV